MARSLLFPDAIDLSYSDHERLAEAYELACDELVEEHEYTPEKLAIALVPMTAAILTLYRAGQHEEAQLGRYAASRALADQRKH